MRRPTFRIPLLGIQNARGLTLLIETRFFMKKPEQAFSEKELFKLYLFFLMTVFS